jgi:glycosyltransferase involved in cell wall biosynthesis
MRLLIVSSWFPFPPSNGSKLRAFHLLAHLAERHRVTLLSFAEPGEEREAPALATMCEKVQIVPGNPFKAGRLRSWQLLSGMPRSYAKTYSPAMQLLVDAELPNHDAAIAMELGASLYLANRPGIPRLLDELEVSVIRDRYVDQRWGLARARRGLTWWKYSRFTQKLVGQFERTTVVSDVERARLGEIGCDLTRVRVVPNGVDRRNFTQSAGRERGRLVYSGSVTYAPNLDAVRYFANEVLATVRATRPDSMLMVTGSTGDVDVSHLAKVAGVTFTGHLPDVKSLVASSEVCIVPLRSGGGTRLKILEAMALGTPVVSTSKGAEGLAVTHEENILIADSPEAFAAAVLRVLSQSDLRERLSRNARDLVERSYTWDRIGGQLEAVLNEAIEASNAQQTSTGERRAAWS